MWRRSSASGSFLDQVGRAVLDQAVKCAFDFMSENKAGCFAHWLCTTRLLPAFVVSRSDRLAQLGPPGPADTVGDPIRMGRVSEGNRLVLLVIEVLDVERSVSLYREAFGVDLHVDDHGGDDRWISGRHGAFSWHEGAYLHFAIYQAKGQGVTTHAQVGFLVDDLAEAHARAVAAGAQVVHEPRPEPWGPTSRYRDFDGNVISLTERTGG